MATSGQVLLLREYIAEPDDASPYSDTTLEAAIDEAGSPEAAAHRIWVAKAAEAAELVNTSEGGSTRALSNIHAQALAMVKQFAQYLPATEPTGRFSRTRAIERP